MADELPGVEVLRIKPGDRLIVTAPGRLSISAADRIHRQFLQNYPDNEIIILEGGLRLTVARDA